MGIVGDGMFVDLCSSNESERRGLSLSPAGRVRFRLRRSGNRRVGRKSEERVCVMPVKCEMEGCCVGWWMGENWKFSKCGVENFARGRSP